MPWVSPGNPWKPAARRRDTPDGKLSPDQAWQAQHDSTRRETKGFFLLIHLSTKTVLLYIFMFLIDNILVHSGFHFRMGILLWSSYPSLVYGWYFTFFKYVQYLFERFICWSRSSLIFGGMKRDLQTEKVGIQLWSFEAGWWPAGVRGLQAAWQACSTWHTLGIIHTPTHCHVKIPSASDKSF